jgi:putative FmdB family regulatory protein
MPIYIFNCEECDETFDVNASIIEKESGLHAECPRCHSLHTRQMITAGAILRGGSKFGVQLSSGCGPNFTPGCCG